MAAVVENVGTETKGAAKGIEGFIKSNRAKAEGFVQEFKGKLEKGVADVKKAATDNLDKVKSLLKKPAIDKAMGSFDKARASAEKVLEDGVKLTEETIQKLGLAKIADVSSLKEAFDGLAKKLDQLKKKVDGLAKSAGSASDKAETQVEGAAKE